MEALSIAVRPIVTLMLTGALVYGFITKLVGAEAFLSVVGMVITFWFSQRQTSKDGPKERASDAVVPVPNGGNGAAKPPTP